MRAGDNSNIFWRFFNKYFISYTLEKRRRIRELRLRRKRRRINKMRERVNYFIENILPDLEEWFPKIKRLNLVQRIFERQDFISPMISTITYTEKVFFFSVIVFVMVTTGALNNQLYSYGNYIDADNEFYCEGIQVGSSDTSEEEYTAYGFRVTYDWEYWIKPRYTMIIACNDYVWTCQKVKQHFCDKFGYEYEWSIKAIDRDEQELPKKRFCLDFKGNLPPKIYMQWLQQRKRYLKFKILNEIIKRKTLINLIKGIPTFDISNKFNPKEDKHFFDEIMLEKITKVSYVSLLFKFTKLKIKNEKNKIKLIQMLLKWQNFYYFLIDEKEEIPYQRLIEEDDDFFRHELNSYSNSHIKALTLIYINIIKRDLPSYFAKLEFSEYHGWPMIPLDKFGFGQLTTANKAFRLWQKFKNGLFVATEPLKVPCLRAKNDSDKPDFIYEPDENLPFQDIKLFLYEEETADSNEFFSKQREDFEPVFFKDYLDEMQRIKRKYSQSTFALTFERNKNIRKNHRDQDIKLQRIMDAEKLGKGLMPDEIWQLQREKKKLKELEIKKKKNKK